MKKYEFTTNSPISGTGRKTIEAETKKAAIEAAQSKFFGVNVSSFRVVKASGGDKK